MHDVRGYLLLLCIFRSNKYIVLLEYFVPWRTSVSLDTVHFRMYCNLLSFVQSMYTAYPIVLSVNQRRKNCKERNAVLAVSIPSSVNLDAVSFLFAHSFSLTGF